MIRAVILSVSVIWLAAGGAHAADAFRVVDRASKKARKAMAAFANGRKGYAVWESRRPSGTDNLKYRIWKRNLDGTGLSMISGGADLTNYAHLGPRVSPDGRHVVFAGKRWNSQYDRTTRTIFNGCYAVAPFDVWVVPIDASTLKAGKPRELKELRGRAGTSFEDHFFEWKNNETVYVSIPRQQGIFEVNIKTGRIGRQVVSGVRRQVILSPSGKILISGGQFAPTKPAGSGPAVAGTFKTLRPGGCQVRISGEDNWLVWMHHGSGGGNRAVRELSKYNVKTGAGNPLLTIIPSLPPGHNYLYFPSLSRDMTILTICGSDGHSHAHADYEVFLFPWNPKTCEPTGKPVRYSFNDRGMYPGVRKSAGHSMDRWPDVWVYNPKFAGGSGAGQTGRVDKGPGPLEGLTSKLLAAEVKRLKRAKRYTGVLRVLDRYAADKRNADRAAEAARIIKHLQVWTAAAMKRARDTEPRRPGDAMDLYTEIEDKLHSRPAGVAAAKRIGELRADKQFVKQLAAWSILRRMRRSAAAFQTPKGAKPTCKDKAFAIANASIVQRIQGLFVNLQTEYPLTRAMLEARSLVLRYAIAVPHTAPTSTIVVGVVLATVTRRSKPLTAEQVFPYTEVLICTEYKIRKVLSGKIADKRIVTMQVAMRDAKYLPPAAFKIGQTYKLKLGLWSQQTHYQGHPVADDIHDLDATILFIFSAEPAK